MGVQQGCLYDSPCQERKQLAMLQPAELLYSHVGVGMRFIPTDQKNGVGYCTRKLLV